MLFVLDGFLRDVWRKQFRTFCVKEEVVTEMGGVQFSNYRWFTNYGSATEIEPVQQVKVKRFGNKTKSGSATNIRRMNLEGGGAG